MLPLNLHFSLHIGCLEYFSFWQDLAISRHWSVLHHSKKYHHVWQVRRYCIKNRFKFLLAFHLYPWEMPYGLRTTCWKEFWPVLQFEVVLGPPSIKLPFFVAFLAIFFKTKLGKELRFFIESAPRPIQSISYNVNKLDMWICPEPRDLESSGQRAYC